jgi:lipopolysaccharide transport system permease protein
MYAIINAYQNILVFGKNPEWSALLYPVVLSLLMCIAGYFLYKNAFNQMVDEL